MKGQKNTNWEFHGFASNPQKSYEAGKKGSVLATQASLKEAESHQASHESSSGAGKQSRKGQSWTKSSSKRSESSKQGESESED